MNRLITQDPDILGGKPIIKGTRMSVESILELLASGEEVDTILKEYPFLSREQIQAAIDYAAKLVGGTKTYIFETAEKVTAGAIAHEISRRH